MQTTIGSAYLNKSGSENKEEAVVHKVRELGFVALHSEEVLTALGVAR